MHNSPTVTVKYNHPWLLVGSLDFVVVEIMNYMGEATLDDDAGTVSPEEVGKSEPTYDSHGCAHMTSPRSAINHESTTRHHSSDSVNDSEAVALENYRQAVSHEETVPVACLLDMGLTQNDIEDIEKACM